LHLLKVVGIYFQGIELVIRLAVVMIKGFEMFPELVPAVGFYVCCKHGAVTFYWPVLSRNWPV